MTTDVEPLATGQAEPTPTEVPPGTLIFGFVHAQINVSDLDRSIRFYELRGFEVISKGTIKDPEMFAALGLEETRRRGAFLRIPGRSTWATPMIDMIQFIDPPPTGAPYPTLNHLGIARLCFKVDDIEAAGARLQALGVELVGPVGELVTKGGGMRSKVLCFRDPDGTMLEYAQINVRGPWSLRCLGARPAGASGDLHPAVMTNLAKGYSPAVSAARRGSPHRLGGQMQRDGQFAILDRIMAHRAAGNTTDLAPAMYENPVETYTDPERYEREVMALFRGCPIVACMTADVARPGDYVTLSLVDVPILVARGADGEVRAFRNVCRHRGACVVEGRGAAAKSFMCPYHGWSYRLDGRLVNPTHQRGFEGLDRAEHGLAEMACDEAAGFVFVHVEGASGTLDANAWLGPLAAELAQFDLASFTRFRDCSSPHAMNWKLMGDTFCEQYHVRHLHHTSLAPAIQSDNSLYDSYGVHGRMVTPYHAVAELDDRPREAWQLFPYAIISYMIRPNTILLVLGDFVELFQLLPDGVDRTTSVLTLYATEAARAKGERHLAKSFDLLRRVLDEEDYAMCEQIQRSFRSGAQSHIMFGRNEPGLVHYHQSVEALLRSATGQAVEVPVAFNGHARNGAVIGVEG